MEEGLEVVVAVDLEVVAAGRGENHLINDWETFQNKTFAKSILLSVSCSKLKSLQTYFEIQHPR